MEQNNKLIAEFMGLTNHHNDSSMMVRETLQGNEVVPIDVLQYHTSWDWLMPVIHKILKDNDGTEFFNFSANISHALFNNNINNAYKSVVEFIKDQNTEVIGSFDENGDLIF